jgi:glyoxylase-like metal-dependent hydrolase (beta-lactamase superfamily II)
MTATFEAATGITAIDTMMVGRPEVTSAYLLRADELAIVETGPTTSVPAVLEGLAALGVGPRDLAHIIVTHIHLDHAGGAGALAPHFPTATVWVHERGAPHLADPTKLVSSAARVYGEDRMLEMFGPVDPVPAERIRALTDGDEIKLGGRALSVIYTPGHASHQVCFVDSQTGALFTGDALGVFLPGLGVLRPATPPPEFDLEKAVESIHRVESAHPTRLLFSHFGPADDVGELCALAIERLRDWTGHVAEAMAQSSDLEFVTTFLAERTARELTDKDGAPLDPERYELLSSIEMNAMGILRYLHKRRASPA